MNEFSLVCRILGTLFHRAPDDPLLAPLLELIKAGKLAQQWPLQQDELLMQLAKTESTEQLAADFNRLFITDGGVVTPFRSHYTQQDETQYRAYISSLGVPVAEGAADSFGQILLAASWIEDHPVDVEEQLTLFEHYLLPWHEPFLGKVEAHAETLFYRLLARLAREAVQAMWDELLEDEE